MHANNFSATMRDMSQPQPLRPTAVRLVRVDSLDASAAFPALRLFGGFHAGLRPTRIALAFALLLTVSAAGRLWDGLSPAAYGPTGLAGGALRENQLIGADGAAREVIAATLQVSRETIAQTPLPELKEKLRDAPIGDGTKRIDQATYARLCELIDDCRPRQSFDSLSWAVRDAIYGATRSALSLEPQRFHGDIRRLFIEIPSQCWSATPWFTAFFSLVCLGVLGVGGGLLCRLNAGDLSTDSWGMRSSWSFIRPRAASLVLVPLVGATLGLVFWSLALFIGVLGAIPLVNIASGLLFGLSLASGFIAVICWIALFVGMPLLSPAIACDGCDAVEALQRSGAYLLGRPLHFLGLGAIAVAIFIASVAGIDLIAVWTWSAATGAFSTVAGDAVPRSAGELGFLWPFTAGVQHPLGWTDATTASLIEVWRTIFSLLIGGALLSVWYALSTRWYLVLRKSADGTALGDLWDDSPAKDLSSGRP